MAIKLLPWMRLQPQTQLSQKLKVNSKKSNKAKRARKFLDKRNLVSLVMTQCRNLKSRHYRKHRFLPRICWMKRLIHCAHLSKNTMWRLPCLKRSRHRINKPHLSIKKASEYPTAKSSSQVTARRCSTFTSLDSRRKRRRNKRWLWRLNQTSGTRRLSWSLAGSRSSVISSSVLRLSIKQAKAILSQCLQL